MESKELTPVQEGQNDFNPKIQYLTEEVKQMYSILEKENNCYIAYKGNKPPVNKSLLYLNNKPILMNQTISVLVADPGNGKSSVCEKIMTSLINPSKDCLGFKVDDSVNNILYVDFERPSIQVYDMYIRAVKGAGLNKNLANIILTSGRGYSSANDKMIFVENLVDEIKPELLILDGAGDLVDDQNDTRASNDVKVWIRKITSKYNLSIFTTLHPNKGTETLRGHIGSELSREAQCVLLIKDKKGVKTITSNFQQGKNSHGDNIESSYAWDDSLATFVSCETPKNIKLTLKDPSEALNADEIVDMLKLDDYFKEGVPKKKAKARIQFLLSENKLINSGVKKIEDFLEYLLKEKYLNETPKGNSKFISLRLEK